MRYYPDFEFIEGFKKPWFGKRRHFIDLISVGIVAEDGREYYAISDEFNYMDADEWVRKNVLDPMVMEWIRTYSGEGRNYILDVLGRSSPAQQCRIMQNFIGKSNAQIKFELMDFFGCWIDCQGLFYRAPDNIEVWGYYADYDWVLLCSLFGRMIDLPKGFPMYCKDLKQEYDRLQKFFTGPFGDFKTMHPDYPVQHKEHSAIWDARFQHQLHLFLIRKDKDHELTKRLREDIGTRSESSEPGTIHPDRKSDEGNAEPGGRHY